MRSILVASLASLAACMAHAVPSDKTLETTSPPAPAATTLPRQLRVVAFNVHMVDGATIARGIDSDPLLRNADLIMLEEVHRRGSECSGACALGEHLGFYSVYAPGHVHGDGTDGVALLSRSPILSAEVIELPHFDTHINSQRKVAIAATILVDGRAGHRLRRAPRQPDRRPRSPHADAAGARARRDADDGPVIIAGDFNTSPFTWLAHLVPILTTTQDDHLEELVRAHGFDTPVKDSGPTSRWLSMKLDAIYTRGFDTVRFATNDGDDISDHLALWAVMNRRS